MKVTRRQFLKTAGGVGAATAVGGFGAPSIARADKHHVVVIGGGFGGSTCARYLRRANAGIDVTLIEPKKEYVTCPFSNLVLGGLRDMKSITQSYGVLKDRFGVNVVHDYVTEVDPAAKKVKLKSGKELTYDRLVMSPGIDFKWGAIQGYDEAASEVFPHAWQGGPQTVLLKKKLDAMPDGGVVVMGVPGNPFRCPPGPYERASMIAWYLKNHKPKSKLIILDAKDDFSKKGLFLDGWKKNYGSLVEWVPSAAGGTVTMVDAKRGIVDTELQQYKPALANIIPPQHAGEIARKTGLANEKGWCPIDPKTFESKKVPGIHVIGDSSIAGALPKSGFAANSEGKMCAAAIVSIYKGEPVAEVSFVNTCYSLVAPKYGISVAGIYRLTEKGIVQIEGGVSPKDASDGFRQDEAKYALGWYDGIVADTWGTQS